MPVLRHPGMPWAFVVRVLREPREPFVSGKVKGQRGATSANASSPSPHHRVRTPREERSTRFPCLTSRISAKAAAILPSYIHQENYSAGVSRPLWHSCDKCENRAKIVPWKGQIPQHARGPSGPAPPPTCVLTSPCRCSGRNLRIHHSPGGGCFASTHAC